MIKHKTKPDHWLFIYLEVDKMIFHIIDSVKFIMTDKFEDMLNKFVFLLFKEKK